jgi:hypothetical protein
MDWLKKELQKENCLWKQKTNSVALKQFSEKLYEKGYSGMDIIYLLEKEKGSGSLVFHEITEEKRYELLFVFHRIRRDLRNEKILLFFILHFIFVSSNVDLENISFM